MRSFLRAALVGALLLLSPAVASAQLRTVAVFEDPAPGATGLFDFFNAPLINSSGAVAFVADLDDGSIGLWSEAAGVGQLGNVALAGDPAAGASNQFIESVLGGTLHFNDLGYVAFGAELDDFSQALYTDRGGSGLTLIAREGDTPPATAAGREYQSGFTQHAFGTTHSGVAFHSSLSPGDAPNNFPSNALYSEAAGTTLMKVAELGDLAPGSFRPSVGGEANFDVLRAPTSNNSGRLAFAATTNASTGVDSIGAAGVWTAAPDGTIDAVALQGQLASGTANEYSQFFGGVPMINDAGDIAFTATLTGLIGGQLRDGVWAARDGGVVKIALESESAAGTASTFEQIDSSPLINAAGGVAFMATLADGRQGIWNEPAAGEFDLLVLEGDASPVADFNFDNIVGFAMNDGGQIAFTADLDDFATRGVFATNPSGELVTVMLSGDVVDLGDVILQVESIEFLSLVGQISSSGVPSGLNSVGQIALAIEGEVQDGLGGTGEFIQAIVVSDIAMGDATLPGDFNLDGRVDAIDYAVWREGLGGEFTPNDFVLWRGNYGATLAAGAQATPEPAALILLMLVAIHALHERGTKVPREYSPVKRWLAR